MKKFITFLSLALAAVLVFTGCKGDNNDPAKQEVPNYLNGKTFQNGEDPKTGDTQWAFTRIKFVSNSKAVIQSEYVELDENNPQQNNKGIYEVEASYTYTKPNLVLTITKIITANKTTNNVTTVDQEAQKQIGVSRPFAVNEGLNTITSNDSEDPDVYTLRK